jgi:hypothetical protein
MVDGRAYGRLGPIRARSLPWPINESALPVLNGIALPLGALRPSVCPPKRHDPGQSWRPQSGCSLAVRSARLAQKDTIVKSKATADHQSCDPGVTPALDRVFAEQQLQRCCQKVLISQGFLKGMVGAPGLEPGTR